MSKQAKARVIIKGGAWFAASIVFVFRVRRAKPRQVTYTAWENVYLVRGVNETIARQRAIALARRRQDMSGEIQVNGASADLLFMGVRKVVSVAANPENKSSSRVTVLHEGVEATYSAFRLRSMKEVRSLARGEEVSVIYEE